MIQVTLPDRSRVDMDPARIDTISRLPEDPFTRVHYDGELYEVNETPEEIQRRIQETDRRQAVQCQQHGSRLGKCFIQDNGEHMAAEKCSCVNRFTRLCKVDAHRSASLDGGAA